MNKRSGKKGFTLIELLVVIILIGVLMAIALPAVRNLTYGNSEKKYQTLEKLAYEASKLYVKNYRGEMTNASSDCFNVPYDTLLNEGLIEEEDINCTGNIIIDNTSGKGNEYQAYLTCKDKNGKTVHEAEGGLPLYCKGFSGNFVVNYELYEDTTHTQSYNEGDWTRYVYGTYSSSNPYSIEIDRYEYTKDLLNWLTLNPSNQEYQNYNGNIYVRAVDQANNVSNMNNHIVRADSKGPEFTLTSDEHSILNGNQIEVGISDVTDSGIGVDKADAIYSFDGGATWVKDTSKIYAISTNAEIQVKDKLGNITANPIQTIYACSSGDGDATAGQILTGKTAWVKGQKITGTMPNRGAVTQTLNAGGSYTIPAGYHNGSGKITAASLASQTQGTATASQILSGQTAWVNGSKVTGNMPNRSSSSNVTGDTAWHYNNRIYFATDYGYYPAASYGNFTNVSEKYISYSSLASVIGLTADKIMAGNTILGITGTASPTTEIVNNLYSGNTQNYNISCSSPISININQNDSYTPFGQVDTLTYDGKSDNIYLLKKPDGSVGIANTISITYNYRSEEAYGQIVSTQQVIYLKDAAGNTLDTISNSTGNRTWNLFTMDIEGDYVYFEYHLYGYCKYNTGHQYGQCHSITGFTNPVVTYLTS